MVKEEVCGIASTQPLFIVELDKKKNQIVLGEEKDLYKTELIAKNFNFQVDFDKVLKIDNVTAKVRYASKPAKVRIEKVDAEIYRIIFDEPQKAITKGQSVVLYCGDMLLGGGIIC